MTENRVWSILLPTLGAEERNNVAGWKNTIARYQALIANPDLDDYAAKTDSVATAIAAAQQFAASGFPSATAFIDEDGDAVLVWRIEDLEVSLTVQPSSASLMVTRAGQLKYASGEMSTLAGVPARIWQKLGEFLWNSQEFHFRSTSQTTRASEGSFIFPGCRLGQTEGTLTLFDLKTLPVGIVSQSTGQNTLHQLTHMPVVFQRPEESWMSCLRRTSNLPLIAVFTTTGLSQGTLAPSEKAAALLVPSSTYYTSQQRASIMPKYYSPATMRN